MGWVLSLLLTVGPETGYRGDAVVRVSPTDATERAHAIDASLDVWTEGTGSPGKFDILVDADGRASLDVAGIAYDVVIDDVGERIDEEHARLQLHRTESGRAGRSFDHDGDDWYDDFRELDAVEARIDRIAERWPERIEVTEIGRSLEDRPIRMIRVRGEGDPTDRPAVFFNGTQHAREWISPMVTMYLAEQLARHHADDARIQAALDAVDVLIVPMVNPDGYLYTWSDDRLWRKNRRDGHGVDLNRNWSEGFGVEPGSSPDPESNNFHGEAAFSEPETRAIRDVFAAHPEIVAHIDFHAYSALVLYPYSHFDAAADPALDALVQQARGWAVGLGDALEVRNGYEYIPLQGYNLYPAAGVSMDWSFAEHQTLSFTVELRPNGEYDFPEGFLLPPEEIRPTAEEQLDGVLTLLEYVRDGGPDPLPAPPPPPEPEDTGADDAAGGETGDGDDDDDGSSEGPEPSPPRANSGDEIAVGCACGVEPAERGQFPLVAACLAVLTGFRRRRTRRVDVVRSQP